MLNALFSLRVYIYICIYVFQIQLMLHFQVRPINLFQKKFKSSKKFFSSFSLYFQRFLDPVLTSAWLQIRCVLNVFSKATKITGYNITRKTAPKYFEQYSKSNFLTTTRWPLWHCIKKYNRNYRHLQQNDIAQRKVTIVVSPFYILKNP